MSATIITKSSVPSCYSNNSELHIYYLISIKKSPVTIIRDHDFVFSFFNLVTQNITLYFQLRVSNSKVKKIKV